MQFLVFSTLVFSLLVAVFALQNSAPVTVSFAIWSFQISLVIVILGSATFGALAIISLATLVQFRLRRSLHKANHRIAELETELAAQKEKLEQNTQLESSSEPEKPDQPTPVIGDSNRPV